MGAKLNSAHRRELDRLYNESYGAVARRYHPGDHDGSLCMITHGICMAPGLRAVCMLISQGGSLRKEFHFCFYQVLVYLHVSSILYFVILFVNWLH